MRCEGTRRYSPTRFARIHYQTRPIDLIESRLGRVLGAFAGTRTAEANEIPSLSKTSFISWHFGRRRGGALRIVALGRDKGLRSGARRDDAQGRKEEAGGSSRRHRRRATRVSILRRNFLATRLNATTSLSTFFRVLFCSLPPPPFAKLFPIPRRCNIIFSRLDRGPQEPRALE